MFALQIPFYVVSMVVVRYISAVGRNVVLMIGAFGNVTINGVLNYWFMPLWGVTGIALSTVFVYIFSASVMTAYTFWHLRKQLRQVDLSQPVAIQPRAF